jgi:endonuclease IV
MELLKKAPTYYEDGKIDYVELTAIIGSFDKKNAGFIKGMPVVIHCDNNCVDFSDRSCRKRNVGAFKVAQEFADFLGSAYIITHPGYVGNVQETNWTLDRFGDGRVCIENMPGRTMNLSSECIGRTVEELKQINARKFCLDFSHAIKAALTLGKGPYEIIADLKSLNPVIYHISGGYSNSEADEHLNLDKGDFDLKRLLSFVHDSGLITVETPKKDLKSLDNDIRNIEYLKSNL